MRERAKWIRGKLTVWTVPDSGTEIELSVPAAHAYTASDSSWRSWLRSSLVAHADSDISDQQSVTRILSIDGPPRVRLGCYPRDLSYIPRIPGGIWA